MGRRGRRRKLSARYRGGRINWRLKQKPKEVEERIRIARAQPHRRELKSNDRASELAESALGRLKLRKIITAGERAAGETFARIVGSYRSVIEGPRPVRSLNLPTASEYASPTEEDVAPRFDCPSQYADPIERQVTFAGRALITREWPCQISPEGCQCAQRRARYSGAYEAIAQAGRRAVMAVIRVAVRGEEPTDEEILYLKRGLSAAQQHLGLTDIED